METQTSSCQCPHSSRPVLVCGALLVSILGGIIGAFANSYINTRMGGNNNQPTTFTYVVTGGTDVSLKAKEASPTSNLSVIPEDIRVLQGMVKEINGNKIILDVHTMNINQDANLNLRTVRECKILCVNGII